jgi:hypothetical protein
VFFDLRKQGGRHLRPFSEPLLGTILSRFFSHKSVFFTLPLSPYENVSTYFSPSRAFAGVGYRLPYLIQSSLQVDSEGVLRAALGKSMQITNKVSGFSEVEFDTGTKWDWRVGLEATLTKQFSLITEYHSDYGFGGGIGFRF